MRPGEAAGAAIARSVEAAQHVEKLGYKRYWLAEHHSIAGSPVQQLRSLLVMSRAQPKRSVWALVESCCRITHRWLWPSSLGRLSLSIPAVSIWALAAPQVPTPFTARALRRDLRSTGDDFPELLQELRAYLGPPLPGQKVFAIPGQNTNVPITLLGSSDFSAQLAGHLGLPFAFAAHFAPDYLLLRIATLSPDIRPPGI